MKTVIVLISFFVLATQLKAQTKKYLEVRGYTDLMGNISLSIPVLTKEQKKDSLINNEAIAGCFKKNTEAIDVINRLAKTGWYLLSAANINRDKEGRPNSEFIVYYFVKDFNQKKFKNEKNIICFNTFYGNGFL